MNVSKTLVPSLLAHQHHGAIDALAPAVRGDAAVHIPAGLIHYKPAERPARLRIARAPRRGLPTARR